MTKQIPVTMSFVADTIIEAWITDLADQQDRSKSWVLRDILHKVRRQMTEEANQTEAVSPKQTRKNRDTKNA